MGGTITWENWLNLAAFVGNAVVTFASSTGIFGATNSDLSQKYQLIITPAGWAFAIWGLIFTWEGVFTIAQMTPRYNRCAVVQQLSPWWWAACAFQVAWTLVFSRDWVTAALVCMLGLLASLLGLLWAAPWPSKGAELWLLRAPFSLHAGWILAASALNVNLQADAARASASVMLGMAVVSLATVFAAAAVLAFMRPGPDPIVCLVASWAFCGIWSELGNPVKLLSPSRYNPYSLDKVTIDGVRLATVVLSVACLTLSVLSSVARLRVAGRPSDYSQPTSQQGPSVQLRGS